MPSTERLEQLRRLSSDELVNAYIARGAPVPSWQATVDGYFLTSIPSASKLASLKYHPSLKRVLLGDCAAEGLIFAMGVQAQQLDFEKVSSLAISHLGSSEAAKEVLHMYGMSAEQTSEQLFKSVIRLLTDAEWSQPINCVAKSIPGKKFYYNISAQNPFPGPTQGTAHHGVDLLFTFLTYQEYLPESMKGLAVVVAGKWLDFVNGKEPWGAFEGGESGDGVMMGFGESGEFGERKEKEKSSYNGLRLCEGLQDRIGSLAAALRGEVIYE